ncbi:MAG TPA: FecR domain-containing protein [Puia sp.]|nr:FecR domain-containing protein [Puia sp.]
MDQDRIDVLLAKHLAGELTPEENEELEWALLANPALRVTLQVLQRMREMPRGGSIAEEREMMERGLARLREPVPERQPAVVVRHWWAAAAAVLVLGVGGVLLYRGDQRVPQQPVHKKEIAARYGTRSYQELPDGSKLWLNAGSKVTYAEGRRELTLTGEAFFDIKHDPDHPFIIHTGELDIKVLGTSFDIKAYPNDSTIETTLINGKVEIDWPGGVREGIVLKPNEKVVIPVREMQRVQMGTVAVARKTVMPDPQYKTLIETSWVEDKLVFRNEAFSDVSRKLERWYNIHISFEDKRYLDDRLTAYFKDQPIRNVMDALQISLGFHYRIEGDTIHITSK